jgi:thymidylate kinase
MGQAKRQLNKVKILAFDGPDKVGKSTIIREVNQRTNYEYLCIDRFIGSAWVYDRLSGRRKREEMLAATERELARLEAAVVINIILKCDRETLVQRILREEEGAVNRIAVLDCVMELYDEYSRRKSILPVVEVDTTGKSVDETVVEILQKVGEL